METPQDTLRPIYNPEQEAAINMMSTGFGEPLREHLYCNLVIWFFFHEYLLCCVILRPDIKIPCRNSNSCGRGTAPAPRP